MNIFSIRTIKRELRRLFIPYVDAAAQDTSKVDMSQNVHSKFTENESDNMTQQKLIVTFC